MFILGLESSCDETSAAVIEATGDRREIKSNIVASQIPLHRVYGGVVPEIAGRAHIEAISSITKEALDKAEIELAELDAVAVTASPGLIGALLVGVNFAKSLAFSNNIPLVPVDHINGHIAAAYLAYPKLAPPFTAIVVSGGHTSIYDVTDYTVITEIGSTRDDAAGEAFDKIGRVIGLPYPAGAEMDALAKKGNPEAVKLPLPAAGEDLDFSFSGLKTAALNYVNTLRQAGKEPDRADLAASVTSVIAKTIASKAEKAIELHQRKTLVLAGGVAANSHLRAKLFEMCRRRGVDFCVPPVSLCGDNAAMIAMQGYYEFLAGVRAGTELNASAT